MSVAFILFKQALQIYHYGVKFQAGKLLDNFNSNILNIFILEILRFEVHLFCLYCKFYRILPFAFLLLSLFQMTPKNLIFYIGFTQFTLIINNNLCVFIGSLGEIN